MGVLLLALFIMWIVAFCAPIIIIYCIAPRKRLREGFKDWWNESINDR